jgi:hypothetical protein
MSFLYEDDDDDEVEFNLSTQLNTLEENVVNKSIEKINVRIEKMNKLKLEEENITAIYEAQMRQLEEKMYVLINTKDEDLVSDEFNIELEQLEIQFNEKFGRKQKKDRRALALGLRIGDKIRFSLNDCNEWWCECIGLENKGLFGLLKSDIHQGHQFNSLNKIYRLFMEKNGMKKRSIYKSKHVEWFRDGKSLGYFV